MGHMIFSNGFDVQSSAMGFTLVTPRAGVTGKGMALGRHGNYYSNPQGLSTGPGVAPGEWCVASFWWNKTATTLVMGFVRAANTALVQLVPDGGGSIYPNVGATGCPAGTVVIASGWAHIYVAMKMGAAGVGRLKIWINGTLSTDFTGAVGSTTEPIKGVWLYGGPSSGSYGEWDDVYFAKVDAEPMRAVDVRVVSLLPAAAGARTEWSPVGAATNVAAVSDALDTTYVETAESGKGDLFAFPAMPAEVTENILGVSLTLRASKVGSGDPNISPMSASGLDTVRKPSWVLPAALTDHSTPFDLAPDGAAWTIAKLNATQFGFELDA